MNQNIPRRYMNGVVYPELYQKNYHLPYYYQDYPPIVSNLETSNTDINIIKNVPEFFGNSDYKTKNTTPGGSQRVLLMVSLIILIVIIMMNYNKS